MGLDSVEIVMKVEDRFNLQIPDKTAAGLVTVGKLHTYVLAALHDRGEKRKSNEIFVELRQIICDQLRVTPESVTPNARFVEDLRVD